MHRLVADDELSDDAIIRFNASSPTHSLDGVSIIGASGGTGHPVVEMVQGTLGGANFVNGHWYGASDAVDTEGRVTGTYSSHSPGGFAFVGEARALQDVRAGERNSEQGGHSAHTLLFGLSGESTARAAIDADGTMSFGDHDRGFDSEFGRPRVVQSPWTFNLTAEADGRTASLTLPEKEAQLGDVCAASHEGIGEADVMLSAHVTGQGKVKVLALNVGGDAVAVQGTLRVVVTRAKALESLD